MAYAFPAGSVIAGHTYKVIAKDRTALAEIPQYMLNAADLFGDYSGELDNGGATVNLLDAGGALVDSVTYEDEFPWPIGADGLGADDEWLGLLSTPITSAPFKYRGRSLERVAFDVPASELSNWVPSPLEGPSPGRANSLSGTPPAIVTQKTISWPGGDLLIRASDTVKIGAVFSTLGPYSKPQLQFYVDDLQATDEPVSVINMTLNGGVYEATLPAQPNNSIVRYRILVDRGSGPEVISPRPSDPFEWWGYFVTPPISTTSALYQLFIKKSNWTQMWDNININDVNDRRVTPGGSAANRCNIRPSWDGTVPAVFISNGVVYDTFVRYQGSRWNRVNGVNLDATRTTIKPLPDRPTGPYKVLSWKINFPDYAPFEGKRKKVVLNKLNQACPGLDDTVGERLYSDPSVDVPVQKTRYARFHVNGGYYHYMLDLEHIDGDMMKRYRAPGEPLGDLFKSDGNAGPNDIEGPWGIGDENPLGANPACPMWSIDDRYRYTYERATNSWGGVTELRQLIETTESLRVAAVASGDFTALRSYLSDRFDVPRVLAYMAVRNWAEVWDDTVHNHFLYQRPSDGKWILIPQDKDLEFGEFFGWATAKSFWLGEQNNIDNRLGWNHLKDAFIKAFRAELWNKIVDLDANGVLNPATYKQRVDQAAATFSTTDYAASPAAASACSFNTELTRMKAFADCRHQDILGMMSPPTCTTGSCGLKGDYYRTLAGDTTKDFTKATLVLTRTDQTIDFNWGTAAPAAAVPVDRFQVRWTGRVTPRFTETYTFWTQSDDGVRLFVNGQQIINRWVDQGTTEWTGTIALTANVPVSITLEYYDATGGAAARLFWSSPSQCRQIIPPNSLTPM